MPAIMDTTINWDSNITKVSVIEEGGSEHEYTRSGEMTTLLANRLYTATVTLNSGYILDSVTTNEDGVTISNITDTTFIFKGITGTGPTITLTSKSNVSKVSIDLTTLTGWDNVSSGEHQISVVAKATGYLDSAKSTAVSFTRAVINPTYQIVQGTSPATALPYSSDNKNDLPTSINQSVKTVFDNYSTMTFEDILSALMVDTSTLQQDQYRNKVDLTKCEKLTDTCSIFFVKDGDKKYYDYTDNINLEVININSSNLNEDNLDNTYCVVIEVDTGRLSLFSFSNMPSSGTGVITTKGDNILGIAFLITKKSNVLLKAGTYQFIETLKSNTELDIAQPINCKVNTLTSDNTYGDLSESGVFNISVINTESNPLELDISGEEVEAEIVYQDNSWKYMSSNGTYTATDTSKLRTIVLETDQNVSQEFYDWAITQGNLVKVEETTGEIWILNDNISPAKTLEKTEINFTSNNTQYTALQYKRSTLGYYTADGSLIDIADADIMGETTSWTNTAYKTITFDTTPTGALLTWLQANGTKQGGTNTFTQVEVTLTKPFKSGAKINSSDATFGRISNMDKTKIYSIKDIAGEYSQIAYITHNGSLWVSTGENNYGTRIYSQTDTSVDMYQNDDQGGCSVIDDVIALEGTTQANESDFANYTATNTLPFYICIVEGTPITLADYSTKPIEEITYDDNLLVWNFYEGKFDSAKPCWITKPQIAHEYNLCKFNNGIEIGFVGQGGDIGYHRIYNDEAKSFTHTGVKETPIGTHTFAQDNTNPILVEQHIINKPVKFYNIGTQKHINIFANGILTSSRISNKYTIKNMKYVGERLISEQEEKDYISEKLKKG